jgi:hypothetical protein
MSLRRRLNSNWIRLAARVGTGLAGQAAPTAGTGATPGGGALVGAAVVGRGFQAMAMGGAKGRCNWSLLIPV